MVIVEINIKKRGMNL